MGQACPASDNEMIEIRQVHEFSEFPPEVQEAAGKFTELQGAALGCQGSVMALAPA